MQTHKYISRKTMSDEASIKGEVKMLLHTISKILAHFVRRFVTI